jgi:phosphoglycerate dehydrogenase-like enzyme
VRIAILDDYQDVARTFADWSRLPDDASLTVFTDHVADPDTLVDRLAPFEALCVMRERTPLPAAILDRLPNLRLIVTTGAQNASIDVAAAAARGVTVCGTQGFGYPTAELAWALILSLALRLPEQTGSMRAGGWQGSVGNRLHGATLGILGLGRLGSLVAGYADAFGMRVLAWSRNLTDERARDCGAERVPLDRLLAASDYVTVHMRLSDQSRGLIGADEIARMKPGACLVNTARAALVDTGALIAAVRSGALAGAALDVYDIEPLPADDPLRAEPNILLTPHIGYVSQENYRRFYEGTLEAVLAFIEGAPVRVIAP